MHVDFVAAVPADAASRAIPVAKGGVETRLSREANAAALQAAAKLARFEGEAGSTAELIEAVDGGARRTLLIGTGAASDADLVKAGSAMTAKLLTSGDTSVAVDAAGLSSAQVVRFLEGAVLRGWRYDVYRTKMPDTQKPTLTDIAVAGAEGAASGWGEQAAVVAGVAFTRELVTEPGNVIYPESFVERCQRMRDLGIELQVLDEAAIRAAGMGALIGVAQGSVRPPRVLVMRWDGTAGAVETPVALVGKGVTFDTGGISLKPGPGMEDMKWDMGGAGAVAGAMMALAGRKARAHVVGIVGLVENMPDGNAQRPGDVVTTMSGQTVEVLNTDAEGRLVLCDVLTWVQKNHAPKVVVDLATLTGAMIIALGHEYGGLFANDDDLAAKLIAAGEATGDKLWRQPLGEAYDKLIESPIADMKNIGPREAGSITAAQFLKRFIDEGVAWAHLDIAGMVWAAKPGPGYDKGATGYGVRLLDRFIADNHELQG